MENKLENVEIWISNLWFMLWVNGAFSLGTMYGTYSICVTHMKIIWSTFKLQYLGMYWLIWELYDICGNCYFGIAWSICQ